MKDLVTVIPSHNSITASGDVVVAGVVTDAGEHAVRRFLEFSPPPSATAAKRLNAL
jgi:hypothetical protein